MWCKNNCDENAVKFRKKMGRKIIIWETWGVIYCFHKLLKWIILIIWLKLWFSYLARVVPNFSNNDLLISFLNYIQFKYIPCDVLVKDVYPLKIVPHYTMIRALAHQVLVFSTLIGRGQTRIGSHWSRASLCCLCWQS